MGVVAELQKDDRRRGSVVMIRLDVFRTTHVCTYVDVGNTNVTVINLVNYCQNHSHHSYSIIILIVGIILIVAIIVVVVVVVVSLSRL